MLADLLVARGAFRACPAAADEGQRHALALPPAPHALAYLGDYAGQLVPRHVRQLDIRIMAHPAVPVAAAQACGLDLDDEPQLARARVGDLL